MRKPIVLAAATILALPLTACSGGDDDDAYCDQVEEAQANLEALELGTSSQEDWDQVGTTLDRISDVAPSEIKDDWENVSGYFSDFQALLDDVGLSVDDLSAAETGELPDGVTIQDLQALQPKLAEIVSDRSLEDSLNTIASDAEDRCGISLDETGNSD